MILPAQIIGIMCHSTYPPLISPFHERGVFDGLSYGLGPCGYDVRLAQDVEIPHRGFALGSTSERFAIPTDLMMTIHDKSTWARRGLSVFNSTAEPGWRGYLTIEMVNHGPPLRIRAGTPIAHVQFHKLLAPTDQPYVGKYQDQIAGPQPAIEEAA